MEPNGQPELHSTTSRLGTERLGRLLLRLSTPSIISMMTVSLYHLADTFWVGKLGYQALAAITITFPFFILVISFGVGTGVGANALASRRFGERNVEATNLVAGQIFTLTAILSAAFLLATAVFTDPILHLSGATPDIMELAHDYLWMFGWGVPFMLFRLMSRNLFQASGDAVKPMIFTLVGTISNAILDPFLIFGWWLFPEMGVAGAALATAITSGLGAGLSLFYLLSGRSVYRIRPRHLVPAPAIIRDIYRVGLPSMTMEISESITFALFNNVLAGFGSVALAAANIAMRVADLAFMPIIGTGHGLLPIVGFCFGARLWKRLWDAVRLASAGLAVMLGLATVVLVIFTPQAIALFNDDPELLQIAVPGMRIFLSTLALIGPSIMFITAFQGLSKGNTALVLSLARQLLFFVPAMLVLPRFLGLTGAWLSIPISDGCGAIIAAAWLYREYRQQQKSGLWELPPVVVPPEAAPRGHATLD